MKNYIKIQSKINSFNNTITVSGDKSISIRCVLLASQAIGTSKIYNLSSMVGSTYNLTSIYLNGWDLSSCDSNCQGSFWGTVNNSLTVYCDQGGSPGTGSIFGKDCN